MDHRDRQLAAIRHEVADRIPVDAQAIENTEAIAKKLGVPETEVAERLGLDGVCIGVSYGRKCFDASGQEVSEWGIPVVQDWGTSHHVPLGAAGSTADVERYPWPDPAAYDYAGSQARAREKHQRYAVRGPRCPVFFHQLCTLMGVEEALVKMVEAPRVFEAALESVLRVTREQCRRYVAACGPDLDILCLWDDFATQRGLMFDPALWRRYIKPRYAELFEIGKQAGKFVWFHSCGDVTEVLPDLIDIGMDVWETVQLHTLPMSPEQLKREYGRSITFFGGINTQRLPFAGVAEVREEVERCITALGRGGGYICGPDHHIKPDVPAENAIELFRAAREFPCLVSRPG